jgi:hypothetical protein
MKKNASTGIYTCHVDTWYHFMRESVEKGTIEIKLARSRGNNSNIFTKNVNQAMYKQHMRKFKVREKTVGY